MVYVGHIPHGFYEEQLRGFFGQFGDITRWRLSRNKKSGRSKHYAFLEFAEASVASIAAEAMDNYLMFDQLLQVRVMDDDKVHPDLFVGANRAFRKVPWKKLDNAKRNRKRTAEEAEQQAKRLLSKEAKRRKKLAAAGIDYDFGGYAEAMGKGKGKAAKGGARAGSAADDNKLAKEAERAAAEVVEDEDEDEAEEAPPPKKKAKTPAAKAAKTPAAKAAKTPAAKAAKTPAAKAAKTPAASLAAPTPARRASRRQLGRSPEVKDAM